MNGSAAPHLDEPTAWLVLEEIRWGGPPTCCPHCDEVGRCYFLQPAAGVRVTRTGVQTVRRVWKCGACRRQFSVLTGTVLEGTRLPLASWIAAVASYAETADVPSSIGSPATRRQLRALLDQALGSRR